MEKLDKLINEKIKLTEENELLKEKQEEDKFQQRLTTLTEKFMDIEYRDFFKHVSYELNREEFDKELEEHDLDSWIPIHCKINQLNEIDYRNSLWLRYTGVGTIKLLNKN